MSKDRIVFADLSMRSVLEAIWQVCFEEQPRAVRYFFDTYFEPQNCLVYETEGQVVAMVHMLPAHLTYQDSLLPAHYIYAAATSPEHRSKGYMSALLTRAAEEGVKRGDHFSFLLPSQSELYQYYGKLGYIPYFQTRFVTLSRNELGALAVGGQTSDLVLSYQQIESVRNAHLRDHHGSVMWGEKAISYAMGIGRLYGGQLICSQSEGRQAYALCSASNGENCDIVELLAAPTSIADLLATIVHNIPAENYRFRLPAFSSIFAGQGQVSTFGMIKPLTTNLKQIQNGSSPYLGLTLD